jgi:hypothetical protein
MNQRGSAEDFAKSMRDLEQRMYNWQHNDTEYDKELQRNRHISPSSPLFSREVLNPIFSKPKDIMERTGKR